MKYSVETIGEGEPVIFLPAGGFKGNEGLIIADYLKDSFKTYLLDLPGYGASEGIPGRINTQAVADWLKDFLDEADIPCATIMGHSIGGALALMFALHYPDRVNRLILLDQGHKKFPKIPFAEFGKFALLLPLLNLGVSLIKRPLLTRLLPFFTAPPVEVNGQEVENFCRRMKLTPSPYITAALKTDAELSAEGLNLLFTYYNVNQPKLLNRIKVETLLIYGTFKAVNDKEEKRTEQAVKTVNTYKAPITTRPVEGGHYVLWEDDFPWSDVRQFLTAGITKEE